MYTEIKIWNDQKFVVYYIYNGYTHNTRNFFLYTKRYGTDKKTTNILGGYSSLDA